MLKRRLEAIEEQSKDQNARQVIEEERAKRFDLISDKVTKLMKHFKEPTWQVQEDSSPTKSGLQLPSLEDTFAFASQIL